MAGHATQTNSDSEHETDDKNVILQIFFLNLRFMSLQVQVVYCKFALSNISKGFKNETDYSFHMYMYHIYSQMEK